MTDSEKGAIKPKVSAVWIIVAFVPGMLMTAAGILIVEGYMLQEHNLSRAVLRLAIAALLNWSAFYFVIVCSRLKSN